MNLDSNKIEYENDNDGKIKKVHYIDFDFFMWNYEAQTKMKHLIFNDYFDKFVKILGSYHKLNYIDGFAGCGAYYETNTNKLYFGSPVLAGETIKYKNPDRKVQIVVIDKDIQNLQNLEKIFRYRKLTSLKPLYINDDFDTAINKILDTTNLAPTFFLVDPFGFSIKYSTLKRIMNTQKSELFFNFMFNSIQRFLKYEKVEDKLKDLFGCDDFKNIMHSTKREAEIIHLFVQQLKKIAKFVFPYRIQFPDKDMTYYYMVHATNHIKGISIMKDCYAKYNDGHVEYYGADEIKAFPLFQQENFINDELDNFITNKYIGKRICFKQILEECIDTTEYLERDITNSIKRLRDANKVKYTPIPATTQTGRKKKKIDGTDIIEFS